MADPFKKFNDSPRELKHNQKQQQKQQKQKNGANILMNQQWKSEQDYKRMIVQLQLQNQKYRNQLYQLGQTVNKILDKTKLPQTNKTNTPGLQGQLQLVKKQLHNVNQFIEIYQRELHQLGNKKRQDQLDSITSTEQILKTKTEQLTILKKQVKELTHKNKGLQYKLLEYNRKNRAKSLDQQSLQLKQLINQNKNLKTKLEDLNHLQEKKQQWLKNNKQSAKNLQQKIIEQETKFPKIKSRAESRQKSQTSLPKLQSQKKIYTKWLQTNNKGKGNQKLQKQLQDLQKINKMVQQKIQSTTKQIRQIQDNIHKLRQKVEANQSQLLNQTVQETFIQRKDFACQVMKKVRKTRRDWVGKFESLRFSDSRTVRQESRLYRILCNSAGYYQFSYYSVKDPKKIFVGKLPFDSTSITYGKESTFTVQYPDFIKNIKVKINLKTQRITQMILTSNVGLKGQFSTESPIIPNPKDKKQQQNSNNSVSNINNNDQQIYYDIDVRGNQAITKLFGSYGVKFDQKKNVVGVWLQGIGAEVIQDFVQELI